MQVGWQDSEGEDCGIHIASLVFDRDKQLRRQSRVCWRGGTELKETRTWLGRYLRAGIPARAVSKIPPMAEGKCRGGRDWEAHHHTTQELDRGRPHDCRSAR